MYDTEHELSAAVDIVESLLHREPLSANPVLAAKQRRLFQLLDAERLKESSDSSQQAGGVDIATSPLQHLLARTAADAGGNPAHRI